MDSFLVLENLPQSRKICPYFYLLFEPDCYFLGIASADLINKAVINFLSESLQQP